MKLLKYIKGASLLLVVAMFGFSCTDLVIEPQQSISDDVMLETMGDFRSAIIGAYNIMQNETWYGRTMPLVPDVMGEDVKQNGSANRYQEFADYEGLPISGHAYENTLWRDVYDGINRVNKMINAEFTPLAATKTEFDQIIGEAYAIRALGHFDLVRMFAQHYTFTADASQLGVPIVTKTDYSALPTRNTVAEVYTQIIDDFNTAISKMTMTRNSSHMMTKEAAQALLSRVYLYKEDFANAVAMADAVIASGKYSLISDSTSYVNQFADGNSSEAIFEIWNATDDRQGSDSVGGMYRASGYGDYLPAKDLLNLLDPADIRWGMFIEDSDLVGIYASHRMNKWPTTTNDDNVSVIRLSEVYLNRAEAHARLGNDALAQADLNIIRKRALATAPDITLTGADLLAEILLERRRELCYEGHRVFDITRHKQDLVRVDCTGDVAFYAYPGDYFIFPIPQPEMDVNPNMVNNPGY